MTIYREWFCKYKPINKVKVVIPNGKSHDAVGVGSIAIKRKTGDGIWIHGMH